MHFLTKAIAFWALTQGLSAANPVISQDLEERQATMFSNPVLWKDYPDLEIIRVGDVFYYTSSTFAFSPGAPVLKSYDLVNWTPVSHSVPTLNFASKYNLNSASDRAYVKGIWASTMQYRNSTDAFHWVGCVEGRTYIYTASGTGAGRNNGEVANWNWQNTATLNTCYYDCGMLVDDNDTVYIAYGSSKIMVAELNSGLTAQVRSQQVYASGDNAYIEGARMYKINGNYYIFLTRPANEEWVLKSSSPWGPYERKILIASISGPISSAGYAHQGGIVSTRQGKWYYMAFMDAYPTGRIPVAAPITWTSDGWPELVKEGNSWGRNYPIPVETSKSVPAPNTTDNFQGTSLSHEWEWNHNPDVTKFRLTGDAGLVLQTATVTNDLFTARNTLTHRIQGPKSRGTFRIDISQMRDGDRAGTVLFRDVAAYIGIHKEGSAARLVMVNNLNLDSNWNTRSTGTVVATGPTIGGSEVFLRIQADVTPAFGSATQRTTSFFYSTDGSSWTQLGPAFPMTNAWEFFTGYRFAVFNLATKSLGGQVSVKSFSTAPF
jgi:beta-xylosidase